MGKFTRKPDQFDGKNIKKPMGFRLRFSLKPMTIAMFQVEYYHLVMTFTVRHGKIPPIKKRTVKHLFDSGHLYHGELLIYWRVVDFKLWFWTPDQPDMDSSLHKSRLCAEIVRKHLYNMVGGFKHEFYVPFHIWDVIRNPIDELIFFRGVGIPLTR